MNRWKFVDRTFVWFGNRSLDWLEKLPKFQNGAIAQRQHSRERQRAEAEAAHIHTKLPEGVKLDFLFFRLTETFPIEDAEKLRQGIKRLLPFLETEFWHKDFSRDFTQQAKQLRAGGWWNLGWLVRNTDRLLFSTESRKMPELPEEVAQVQVHLHRPFASSFVLTFDVYLTEKATQKLLRVHDQRYLSTLRFIKLFPWGINGAAHGGENTSERALKHEVLRWGDQLRKRVELCIAHYVKGNFLKQSTGDKFSRLPAIEVFALKGTPTEPDKFNEWFERPGRWWDSLGFGFSFLTYKSKELLYVDPADDSPHGKPVQRFVVLSESFEAALPDYVHRPADRFAVTHEMSEMLRPLLPLMTVLQHLELAQKHVEELRKQSFDMMKPTLLARGMGKHIKLSNAIHREGMLLQRISMEYEHTKRQIEIDVVRAVSDIRIDDPHFAEHLGGSLADRLVKWVASYQDFLQKNHAFVSEAFSQYLATKNMKVMYKLQNRMWWLTVAVTVATFFTIATQWDEIKKFLSQLFDLLPH